MALHQRKILNIVFTLMAFVGVAVTAFVIWMVLKNNEFKTYRDMGGVGLSIRYPATWTVAPYTNGTVVTFFSPLENSLDIFKENVNIVVQDLSQQKHQMNLDQYTKIAIGQMQAVFKNKMDILISKPALLDGAPGYQIVIVGKGTENSIKLKCIWALKGTRAYQFTYGALASQYDKYIGQVDAMLRSLKIP
jgi:hypothetical protein